MKTAAKVFIAIVAFVVGILGGYAWKDVAAGELPDMAGISAAIRGESAQGRELSPTSVVADALSAVNSVFYGTPDRQDLTYSAVAGMLASLEDPHTMLLEPAIAARFEEKNTGQYVGVGAELTRDPLGARIKRIFKNSPAQAAGIKPNDVVTHVDGEAVGGKDLVDVSESIRGKAGTSVRLGIFRENSAQPLNFTVRRRAVDIQDVYGTVLTGDLTTGRPRVGYLEVRSFSETIMSQFDEELAALESQGIKGLIIDLRGNPGGLLSAAVDMSARFIDGKVITTMKMRNGEPEVFVAPSGWADGRSYPLVVLVDENSASASEIFTGAVKDYHRGTIVGQRTYGKGSVQRMLAMADGSQIKLTIARYYLPNGESIQRRESDEGEYISGGIEPDIDVEKDRLAVNGDLKTDNQLRKAVSVVLEKL
ncbi:MAG: S41 family peptidase [Armatimonadota bacterium]|nr:S41 family peptidase [Armatimonadota bacterium]